MFIVGLVALAAVAISAPTAGASGSLLGLSNDCGTASQPFAQFGDYRSYTFGANGGLESGGTGWSLSGARVVSGNESYFVHSKYDRYSLLLSTGNSAYTPKLCMGTTSTTLRFFVRSGDGGKVRVHSILNLDSLLGLVGVSSIQLKFTELSGSVQIDDVYVDPWAWRD